MHPTPLSTTPVQDTAEAIATRFAVDYLIDPTSASQAAGQDVIQGLGRLPKSLPPYYFYDDRGSQLFEQICAVPEYYLTRTETALLHQWANDIATITGASELVELGSGSAVKTRLLLDAYCARHYPLRFVPIDVSAGILEHSAQALLSDYPSLTVKGLVSTYELALAQLPPTPLPTRTIAFIGSSLGNLPEDASDRFIDRIALALDPGQFFLLGIDLHKDSDILEAAYNDSQGITAEFNLNMLRHLNWRFDGDFDLAQFRHVAYYNTDRRQVEIYLESLISQQVTLKSLDLSVHFDRGERLLTEISRKFDLEDMQLQLGRHHLEMVKAWTDVHNLFALVLARRQ